MGNDQPQKLIVQVTFNKPRPPFPFLLNGYNVKYIVHNEGSYDSRRNNHSRQQH